MEGLTKQKEPLHVMKNHNLLKLLISKTVISGRHLKRQIEIEYSKILAPDIVFYVISHERSGTHFLINTILKNMHVRKGFGFTSFDWNERKGFYIVTEWLGPYHNFNTQFQHIDRFFKLFDQKTQQASIIKSHCDRQLYNFRYKPAKVIYVLRDPRDAMVSFFHFMNQPRHTPEHNFGSFSEFLRIPVSGFLQFGYSLQGNFSNVAERWANHVSGWLLPRNPEVLIIRFEDLKQNYKKVLQEVSEFLGIRVKLKTNPVGLSSSPSVLPRKGIIGDWKNVFTKSDEAFLRQSVEKFGLDWESLVYKTV